MTRNTPSSRGTNDTQNHYGHQRRNVDPVQSGFELRDVSFSYNKKPLFSQLSVSIVSHEFLSVVGPNGAGKSTFIKLLARLLHPAQGYIQLDGKELDSYSRRELARRIAYVPPESYFSLDFTVLEVVLQGRHSFLKAFERYHSYDYDLAHSALKRLGIENLAAKGINNVSSGERQLVVIARSLVQEPSTILLDEPLNHLDLSHQHQVLTLLAELNREEIGILLVAHDLNQASLVSGRMLVFSEGRLVEDDSPEKLLTADLVKRYWGIRPLEGKHPRTKKRQIFLPLE